MKIGERMQDTKKFIVNLIIILIIGCIIFWFGTMMGGKANEPKISDTSLYTQLNEISELTVLEYNYSKVGKFENSLSLNGWDIPLTTKSFLLTYSGQLKAGVNMEKANVSIDDKTILIELPPVEILSNIIDEKSIEVYDETHNIFNQISINDYTEFATQQKAKVEEEAIENGMLSEAATRVDHTITNMFQAIPEIKEAYKIKISFLEESK